MTPARETKTTYSIDEQLFEATALAAMSYAAAKNLSERVADEDDQIGHKKLARPAIAGFIAAEAVMLEKMNNGEKGRGFDNYKQAIKQITNPDALAKPEVRAFAIYAAFASGQTHYANGEHRQFEAGHNPTKEEQAKAEFITKVVNKSIQESMLPSN